MNKKVALYSNISKELYENVSEDGIYVYMSLRILFNDWNDLMWCTTNAISKALCPNKNLTNNRQKESILNGIKELEKINLIKITNTCGKEFLLDLSKLNNHKSNKEFYETSPFSDELEYVESKEIDDDYILIKTKDLIIMYENVKYRKTIFKYLLFIVGNKANKTNIDGKDKGMFYFTKSRTELSIDFGVDKRTIDNYNNLLVQADILYIIKSTYRWKDNNRIVNNFYGLMIDKKYIDNAYSNFLTKYKNSLERI